MYRVYLREGRKRDCHSLPQAGPSCCCSSTSHRHLVGAQEPHRARATEKRPTANKGLLVALHTPTSHPPHHGATVLPQREGACCRLVEAGETVPPRHCHPGCHHHCQRLPCWLPELGQAKEEGKGRGWHGLTQQQLLWLMAGEGSQGNDSIPRSLKSPARHHRDHCCFGSSWKQWRVGVSGKSPWVSAAGP